MGCSCVNQEAYWHPLRCSSEAKYSSHVHNVAINVESVVWIRPNCLLCARSNYTSLDHVALPERFWDVSLGAAHVT